MSTGDTSNFDPAHLAQWLETTRHYLFSDGERTVEAATSPSAVSNRPPKGLGKQRDANTVERDADPAEKALLALRLDTHGARVRFISRVRGKLLRRVKPTAQWNSNPLQELARVFFSHVSFIARNPDVATRLLGWLLLSGDVRIQRRVQKLIDCYASRLARIIERARYQGFIRVDVSPHFAALFFVSLIQGLALGIGKGKSARNAIFKRAAHAFALYRDWIASPAKRTMPVCIYIPAYLGWSRT
jgi:TetR/AcrR family transcriptional regulator